MANEKILENTLPIRNVTDGDHVRVVGMDGKSYRVPKEDFGGNITVDDELSTESENPVQNKVIAETVEDLGDRMDGVSESVGEISETVTAMGETVTALGETVSSLAENKAPIIVNTASGAIASFTDGTDSDVKSLKVKVEPVQDLHGYDSPWPAGGGKNLFDPTKAATNSSGAYGFTITRDGDVYTVAGTSTNTTTQQLSFSVTTNYANSDLSGKGYVCQAFVVGTPTHNIATAWGFRTENERSFAIQLANVEGHATVNVSFRISVAATSQNAWSPYTNLCPITGHSQAVVYHSGADTTDYETLTIPLGDTYYGGEIDVSNGSLVVDRVLWTKNTSTMNNNENYPGWRDSGLRALGYSGSEGVNTALMNVGDEYSYNTLGLSNDILFLSTERYHKTQTEWQALALDIQIIIPLPTPLEVQLVGYDFSTYYGDNTIWSDTGDVEVVYNADTKLYIDGLTEPDADMVADSNIASGKYFMVNNHLFLSTSAIAAGEAIVPGSNCTATNLAAALNAINS